MTLKVLTWNIAWGYGMGSDGTAYRPRPRSHFESSLEAMSQMIHELGADIVLLQEVDFHSARSHDEPELDVISRKSGLLHRSGIISWNRAYVPFPGLSPFGQFGRILSGGGILSRFPIENVTCQLLPKPKENLVLYNWFYLHRYLQIVDIAGVRFCNLHLEAFSKSNRLLHLDLLGQALDDEKIDIAGGDFNGEIELPEDLHSRYALYPSPHPTFPSPDAKETLDGFVLRKNRFENIRTAQIDTGTVSDHFAALLEVDSIGKGFK